MKKINFDILLYKDNNYYKKIVKGYIDLNNPNIGYYKSCDYKWNATDIKTGTVICSRPTRYAVMDEFKNKHYKKWLEIINTDDYRQKIDKFNSINKDVIENVFD